MKHLPCIKAIKFGFKTLFKNPLFFILAVIVSKLLLFVGLAISFLIALPFFMPLIDFIYRIIDILKKGLMTGFMKGLGAGAAGSAMRGGGMPFGGGGGLIGGIGKGGLLKGAAGSVLQTIANLKAIIAEILENPWMFVLFAIGVLIFLLLARMVYDFIILGWTRISFDFASKGSSSLKSLFSNLCVFFKYFIATILFSIVVWLPFVVVGMFLLLTKMGSTACMIGYSLSTLMSLYFGFKFWFYGYFIVDKDAGIMGSLKKSFNVVGAVTHLMILFVLLSVVAFVFYLIASMLPFIAGLSVFALAAAMLWIVGYLSVGFLYRELVK